MLKLQVGGVAHILRLEKHGKPVVPPIKNPQSVIRDLLFEYEPKPFIYTLDLTIESNAQSFNDLQRGVPQQVYAFQFEPLFPWHRPHLFVKNSADRHLIRVVINKDGRRSQRATDLQIGRSVRTAILKTLGLMETFPELERATVRTSEGVAVKLSDRAMQKLIYIVDIPPRAAHNDLSTRTAIGLDEEQSIADNDVSTRTAIGSVEEQSIEFDDDNASTRTAIGPVEEPHLVADDANTSTRTAIDLDEAQHVEFDNDHNLSTHTAVDLNETLSSAEFADLDMSTRTAIDAEEAQRVEFDDDNASTRTAIDAEEAQRVEFDDDNASTGTAIGLTEEQCVEFDDDNASTGTAIGLTEEQRVESNDDNISTGTATGLTEEQRLVAGNASTPETKTVKFPAIHHDSGSITLRQFFLYAFLILTCFLVVDLVVSTNLDMDMLTAAWSVISRVFCTMMRPFVAVGDHH